MPKLIDITNHRFGRLIVLDIARREFRPKGSRVFWRCLCDCGKEAVVVSDKLKNGHTNSCGCLVKEKLLLAHAKHGHALLGAHSNLYTCWANMLQRCRNPKHPKYPSYGGRGIIVCERWEDYRNFWEDVGERPSGMTLDRTDVNGHYEPANVRWATHSEQRLNQRRNQKQPE